MGVTRGNGAAPFTVGKLLIAEPMLGDPNFERSVVLMIEHTEDPIGTLQAHVGVLRPGGVLLRTTPDDQRVPSRDLDNALSNPVLRDVVGLGGAEAEAGTGVGTGVEGGGR